MRGMRVSFAEVEERVATIPGVYECAGDYAADHPEAGEALVLFIVPDEGVRIAEDEVRRHPSGPLDARLDSLSARITENVQRENRAFVACGHLAKGRISMKQLEEKIDRLLRCLLTVSLLAKDKRCFWTFWKAYARNLTTLCQRHAAGYKNYIQQWPVDYRSAGLVTDSSLSTSGTSEGPIPRCRSWVLIRKSKEP